jgi:hypothetical protein
VRGENRWRRRRLAATLVWLGARGGPFLLAAIAAFGAARLVARPANPEALLWWLGIAAVGMSVLHLLYGLATRARAFAALLGVAATFPSRPPSRAAIAWAMPDTLRLRQGLDDLAVGAWTTEVQSRRAALVAALWALEESTHHPGMLWRPGDGDVGVRVTDGDILGLLQLVPRPSIRHRTVTAGAGLAAVALLLSSVTLGVASDRSRPLADGGRAAVPSSTQPAAPLAGENPPVVDPVGPSEAKNPSAGGASAVPPTEPPATATASAADAPASSPEPPRPAPQPSSRPEDQAETAPESPSPAPQLPSGGLVALDAPAADGAGTISPAGAVVGVASLGALLQPGTGARVAVAPATVTAPGVAAASGVDPGSALAPSALVPSALVPSALMPSALVPSAPVRDALDAPALVAPSTGSHCPATAGDVTDAPSCTAATGEQPAEADAQPTGADEQQAAIDSGAAPRGETTAPASPPNAAPTNAAPSIAVPPEGAATDDAATTTPTDAAAPSPADLTGDQRG